MRSPPVESHYPVNRYLLDRLMGIIMRNGLPISSYVHEVYGLLYDYCSSHGNPMCGIPDGSCS